MSEHWCQRVKTVLSLLYALQKVWVHLCHVWVLFYFSMYWISTIDFSLMFVIVYCCINYAKKPQTVHTCDANISFKTLNKHKLICTLVYPIHSGPQSQIFTWNCPKHKGNFSFCTYFWVFVLCKECLVYSCVFYSIVCSTTCTVWTLTQCLPSLPVLCCYFHCRSEGVSYQNGMAVPVRRGRCPPDRHAHHSKTTNHTAVFQWRNARGVLWRIVAR